MEQTEFDSIHDAYDACGPEQYYRQHGADYRNPHEPVIAGLISRVTREWDLDLTHVLDLCAGSGEVTLALPQGTSIVACDPYTYAAYESRTGRACDRWSFDDIAAGVLAGRSFSLVVCSFALHLCEPSRLPAVCWQLAQAARQLLILTPHKRPVVREAWGWRLSQELLSERVRARLYMAVSV